MRHALFAAALLFAAAPAFAQAEDDADIWNDDPYAEQDTNVLAVDRFVGALLDLPIGELAGMPGIEMEGDVRPGDTLRDMGSRRDPAFEENVRGQARALTGVIGHMIRRLSAAGPAFEDWAREMGDVARD